jgi:hypothetical protein
MRVEKDSNSLIYCPLSQRDLDRAQSRVQQQESSALSVKTVHLRLLSWNPKEMKKNSNRPVFGARATHHSGHYPTRRPTTALSQQLAPHLPDWLRFVAHQTCMITAHYVDDASCT